uniref:Uncharacterized protein n=1 Tax=Rhizophora mucronata TaxID=61149 RepID=A0A2P2QA30_RHIMU
MTDGTILTKDASRQRQTQVQQQNPDSKSHALSSNSFLARCLVLLNTENIGTEPSM